eukprot:scaffold36351_cov65-Phaeocystis_antarctica.AAC.5
MRGALSTVTPQPLRCVALLAVLCPCVTSKQQRVRHPTPTNHTARKGLSICSGAHPRAPHACMYGCSRRPWARLSYTPPGTGHPLASGDWGAREVGQHRREPSPHGISAIRRHDQSSVYVYDFTECTVQTRLSRRSAAPRHANTHARTTTSVHVSLRHETRPSGAGGPSVDASIVSIVNDLQRSHRARHLLGELWPVPGPTGPVHLPPLQRGLYLDHAQHRPEQRPRERRLARSRRL